MADAITYADLRFVKVPLKNSVSNHLGQDCEAYEDGELTYENVQVSPVLGGASGLASSALVDKAGMEGGSGMCSGRAPLSGERRAVLEKVAGQFLRTSSLRAGAR